MSEAQRTAGKRLPLREQGRLMIKAMPRATRVGEFVAMWTIAKNQAGATSAEGLAEYWNEPIRTVYRRLDEFRQVWGPVGHETPDKLADHFIADYRARKERMSAADVGRIVSAPVASGLVPPLPH